MNAYRIMTAALLLSCTGIIDPAPRNAQDEELPRVVVKDGARATMEPTIGDLGWLEGTWLGGDGSSEWESHYSSPLGGQIVGSSKEMKRGKAVMIDFEHFYEREGKLRMTPYPFGNRSVEFTIAEFDPTRKLAVFENPDHDFPQKFTYQRKGGDLDIELVGSPGGNPMRILLELKQKSD